MRNLLISLFVIMAIFAGCSNSQPPTVPIDNNTQIENSPAAVLMAGTFEIDLENMSIDITENRTAEYNYNITAFLGANFQFTIIGVSGTELTIELTITNPTSLQVYDVRLIYMNLYGKTVMNPDSYTDLYVKQDIAPFTAFAKESASRAFPVGPGASDTETLILDFPPGAFAAVDFVVVASLPSNTEDPYELSDMDCDGTLTTSGGSAQISVMVRDHQDDVTQVTADTTELTGSITVLTEDPLNPGLYTAAISNTEGAPIGNYLILFKAESPNIQNADTYNYLSVEVVEDTTGPGKVAWVKMWYGNAEIFRMKGDGTEQTRLTTMTDADWEPSWSPDGTQIAWRHGGYDTANLWIMDEDGSNKNQITFDGWNFEPKWTPDAEWIYYWSNHGTGGSGNYLWRIHPNGTSQEQVTYASDGILANFDISPDGNYIAYEGGSGTAARDLWIMDIDGSNKTQLLSTPYWDANPNFNSDGSKIAICCNPVSQYATFFVNPDGTGLEQITYPPTDHDEFYACFGVNDDEMFIQRRLEQYEPDSDEIIKYIIATEESIQLTDDNHYDGYPDWHPGD